MQPLPLDSTLLTPSQAERDPEEEGDYMAFEQLMAEAMTKKGKDEKKKKKKHGHHDSHEHEHGHAHAHSEATAS